MTAPGDANLSGAARAYDFRRSRFAFARARVTKGAKSAAWLRPVMMAATDDRIPAAFSSPMRRYSAGVQAPCAINRLRLTTVSHDAAVRRAIVIGNAKGEFRRCFLIPLKMRIGILAASAPFHRKHPSCLTSASRIALRCASTDSYAVMLLSLRPHLLEIRPRNLIPALCNWRSRRMDVSNQSETAFV